MTGFSWLGPGERLGDTLTGGSWDRGGFVYFFNTAKRSGDRLFVISEVADPTRSDPTRSEIPPAESGSEGDRTLDRSCPTPYVPRRA